MKKITLQLDITVSNPTENAAEEFKTYIKKAIESWGSACEVSIVKDQTFKPINMEGSIEAAKAHMITQIREIIEDMEDQTGESCITTAELEAQSSPCLAADGDYSRLAETFYKDGADVVSYVGSTETKSEFITYDQLDFEVLVQIKELVSNWS
jgi:hypothetical protein